MKSTIRVYKEGKFQGYYKGVQEDGSVGICEQQGDAQFFLNEEERIREKFKLMSKMSKNYIFA